MRYFEITTRLNETKNPIVLKLMNEVSDATIRVENSLNN